jgi:hypothetical protein
MGSRSASAASIGRMRGRQCFINIVLSSMTVQLVAEWNCVFLKALTAIKAITVITATTV